MSYRLSKERQAYLEQLYEKIEYKISQECDRMGDKIPYIPVDGKYPDLGEESINWWTNGFWGGIMWQMFHACGQEKYEKEAIRVEEKLEKAFANYSKLDHDVGFMWLHTSVARYRITGNENAKERGLRMAGVLASRFSLKGEYICAWNPPAKSGMIIDCLMNLPLLFWAEKESGIHRYGDIARAHLHTAMRYLIREDGSCNHIAEFDEETGELSALPGGQGYGEGSSWSRGQAWAIYGLSLAYGQTKEQQCLDYAKKVAHYFIANVAMTDYVSLIDFRAPSDPVYYDTTAAACAACGLLELAKWVTDYEKNLYEEAAYRILEALTKRFCDFHPETDGILQAGSGRYHRESDREVPIIYGDYFLLELVLRFQDKDFLIW